jgi:hypothetical protein
LAALHSDEESEQIAERFLSGKIGVEQFVSKYLQKRTVSVHSLHSTHWHMIGYGSFGESDAPCLMKSIWE